ncbi:hypothetical protein IJ101_01860 [Candidatus Saccharibacteria bacterium]|nr:hypothetical protein [Candidatus Saccharibacteria bacterium]
MSETLNLNIEDSQDNATEWDKMAEEEAKDRRMRDELIAAKEEFIKKEGRDYQILIDEIDKYGHEYAPVKNIISALGNETLAIDQVKYDSLFDYIDERFSNNNANDHEAVLAKERNTYLGSVNKRANILSDSMDSLGRFIAGTNNQALETLGNGIDMTKSKMPDEEVALAQAYLEYFDSPSEETERKLNNRRGDHDHSLGQSLGSMRDATSDARIWGKGLSEACARLSIDLSSGYELTHEAIMKYFDYKYNQYLASQVTPPAQTDSANKQETSSNSKSEKWLDPGIIQ